MPLLTRATGRAYFALQAVAGALWWVLVSTVPAVAAATLGSLNPLLVGALDIPLFVLASALVALGVRRATWVVVPWTLLVTAGMVLYATLTGTAGWGAVAMIAASAGSVLAGMLVLWGRIPIQTFLVGPLAFRPARRVEGSAPLVATLLQMMAFWTLFLVVLPLPMIWLERRWQVDATLPDAARLATVIAGAALLLAASLLGVASAVTMARLGRGTPLPGAMANELVIAGPYRWVRNPMAVAGIAQGVAVGLLGASWLVIFYSLAGGVLWHLLVRPEEERDLAARFREDYARYSARVRCWVPRL
ncbi:isoprenylcysteine carboxylmethyltransferase family protein [Brachybacterium paraconglomeratum]|uniref:methyltransferase family protein n=1 Tax=Brachybacterium paraconglomeratum TaxID=173362 RepID=UPI0031E89001